MKKLLCAAVLSVAMALPAAAETVLQFALPTPETHPRNQALGLWSDAVARISDGQLVVALRHATTGYTGDRIAAAVAEGVYDMAAPGWWNIARYAPDFALPSLPMFYGRSRDVLHVLFDGELHDAMMDRLEQSLRVRVIGRPLALGFGHIYTAERSVKEYADLKGLNIRVPGGSADLARYLVFEATPRRVAIRDLADALRRNLVGGLLATHSFVANEVLWEAGVRHAFLDNQMLYLYSPIVNRTRWEALSDEERRFLTESWDATLAEMRMAMADRQTRARGRTAQNGVVYVEAPADARSAMRATLMKEQPAIAAALEIDPQIVARVKALLESVGR